MVKPIEKRKGEDLNKNLTTPHPKEEKNPEIMKNR